MIALIDGDILRYRCGFSAEHKFYDVYEEGLEEFGPVRSFHYKKEATKWIDGEPEYWMEERIEVEPVENALHSVKISIQKILAALRCTEYKIYLSGKGNYRLDIATLYEYKGNRPDRKPTHYDEITKYLLKVWNAEMIESEEADDAMGIDQYCAYKSGDPVDGFPETCICTIDKDLDMIPGWHYNFVSGQEKYWINEVDGLRNFYRQMITGDRVDNIPGLYWLTEKKATKKVLNPLEKLDTEEAMWAYVRDVYHQAGMNNDDTLLEIGRLLWIRRNPEELWVPPA